MKAIMISIKPQWVEKILSGEKTIEVRNTKPKLETPFKVYVYETKGRYVTFQNGAYTKYGYGRGKVVGEFTCDRINEYDFFIGHGTCGYVDGCESHCLTEEELCEYGKGKNLYGWHISELKVYDQPKEISEFKGVCRQPDEIQCENCHYCDWNGGKDFCKDKRRIITRPPQSWCYVEEV